LRARGAPKSQILIVLSADPDTILVPSGENATELRSALWITLWTFVFSLNSPSASARQASRGQFWPRRRDLRGQRTRIPDFDPGTPTVFPSSVIRSRDKLGPVLGKGDPID
jgi:hypothetical protein